MVALRSRRSPRPHRGLDSSEAKAPNPPDSALSASGAGTRAQGHLVLSYPTAGHADPLWGGPPGPRPTLSSASSHVDAPDFIGEERVPEDPRGPGGPTHN